MPDPKRVVKIAELTTEKPLFGIGINHEKMNKTEIQKAKEKLNKEFQVPVTDPIFDGVADIIDTLEEKHGK